MTIRKTVFDGLEGYELISAQWRMVLITQCGPRIAFLGKNGEDNLFYWKKEGVIRGQWHLCGGHRVWLTRPMADESEDTYISDNEPCRVELLSNGLIVTAPAHACNKLERGMRVCCLDNGRFEVTNFVTNVGEMIYSGGVWAPTCINPTGKVFRIPLGEDNVTWDLVQIVIPRIFAGNVTQLEDPQVHFENNDMVITPMGQVSKRCLTAPKGIIRMDWAEKNISFTKQSHYQRYAHYPLHGCNLAVFIGKDNWMTEMESFGVEQPILPGESIENKENWELIQCG